MDVSCVRFLSMNVVVPSNFASQGVAGRNVLDGAFVVLCAVTDSFAHFLFPNIGSQNEVLFQDGGIYFSTMWYVLVLCNPWWYGQIPTSTKECFVVRSRILYFVIRIPRNTLKFRTVVL